MARVKNLDQITGNLKNLSFYTRKGSSEVFVRTKGGASKEKIKRDPAFAGLRKVNKEFGGCSKMSKQIRLAFNGLEHVAEFNLAPALSSLVKNIQKTDVNNPVGERSIELSKYRYLLAGFDFSRSQRFSTLFRIPLNCNIDRTQQVAVVDIPAFTGSFGLNLQGLTSNGVRNKLQVITSGFFRITASLGIVTDMHLNKNNGVYEPVHEKLAQGFKSISTDWYSTQTTVPAQQLSLNIFHPDALVTEEDTFVLTVIVEFGVPDAFGNLMPVRGVGGGIIQGVR